MWQEILTAFALVCILEGILPSAHPQGQRRIWRHMLEREDDEVRMAGVVSMLLGLLILYLAR